MYDEETTTAVTEETPVQSEVTPELEAKFNAVFGEADDAPAPVSPAARRAVRQAEQEQAEELEQEGIVAPDGSPVEPAAEEPTEEAAAAEEPVAEVVAEPAAELPQLDANTRLAAQALGWTDAAIDGLLKANPELAVQTFTQLADAYTNLSRQFTGDSAAPVAPGPQTTSTAAQSQAPVSGLDKLFTPEGLESFADANGEDLVERFLKPLQQEVIQPLREMQAFMENSRRQTVANEFASALGRLPSSSDLYGDGTRSEQQTASVQKLATLADQIRAGARLQGQELSVTEAVSRAHLILNADRQQAEGRRQVQAQVQKRAQAITAKPTVRRSPVRVGKPGDEAAMEVVEQFFTNRGE